MTQVRGAVEWAWGDNNRVRGDIDNTVQSGNETQSWCTLQDTWVVKHQEYREASRT